jgi:large subunit ribosomal protein L30
MATKLTITQVRSTIGCPPDQRGRERGTVRALGLKRIRHTVEQADTPVIRGMIHKVRHLIEVQES